MHNDFGYINRQIFLNSDRREKRERVATIVMFSFAALYFGGHFVNLLMK